jgi:hypothetical protein
MKLPGKQGSAIRVRNLVLVIPQSYHSDALRKRFLTPLPSPYVMDSGYAKVALGRQRGQTKGAGAYSAYAPVPFSGPGKKKE